MSSERKHYSKETEDQAALWVARLQSGNASPEDRDALERWLTEDPEHRACFSEYEVALKGLDQILAEMVREGELAVPQAGNRRRNLSGLAWISSMAAAAAIAFTIWVVPAGNHSAVAPSQNLDRHMTLADGSRADLKGRTTLTVELSGAERRVRLAVGEAVFSVAKDESRPFIVETPAGTVRVTGTIFGVRAESGQRLDVTVLEGSVEVQLAPAGSPVMQDSSNFLPVRSAPRALPLVAGQQLALAPNRIEVRELSVDLVEDLVAWRHGGVVLDGVPLGDAMKRLGGLHRKAITVDSNVASLRLGGRFDMSDFEGFLAALEMALPVEIVRNPDGTLIVRLREV